MDGCNINAFSTLEYSIISTAAAAMMSSETIKLLIDVGAQPYRNNVHRSESPSASPSISRDNNLCSRIISYAAPTEFEVWSPILESLIVRGFTYQAGSSCLPENHLAPEAIVVVAMNNRGALMQLINHGDSLLWEQFSRTPLTLAVELGLVDIGRILIDSGLPTDKLKVLEVSGSCLSMNHPRMIPFVISQSFNPFLDLRLTMEDLSLCKMKERYNPESPDLWSRSITKNFGGDPWIQLETDETINRILLRSCNRPDSRPLAREPPRIIEQLFSNFSESRIACSG